MLFDTTMPVIMITPIKDMMFSVLPVNKQDQHDPSKSRRNCHQDDERINERCELSHQNQIDHQNRNDEPNPELLQRSGSC